jgi:uncharacterized RDD family membrane protein YckC/predicted transposase YbfD/YdcC
MAKERVFPEFKTRSDVVIGLASPRDRLASMILDIVLLLPLVQFFQSPVKKWILESLLFYKGSSSTFYEMINLMILVILFLSYFTICHYFFGQSIGKLFFKIKVISYHGKVTLFSSFLRAFFVIIELLCLGLPLLALFSHELRRGLHDRVADTLVISLENPVGFPQITWKFRVALISGSILSFFVFGSLLYHSFDDEIEISNSYLFFDKNVCEKQFDEVKESMSAMIELYLVKKLNNECLFNKAREALWKNENKSIAQFAMALAYEDDRELSNNYLKSICDEVSDNKICEFSQWLIEEKSQPNKEKLNEIAFSNNQEDFIRAFAASYYRSLGDYSKVEEILKIIRDKKQLGPLIA